MSLKPVKTKRDLATTPALILCTLGLALGCTKNPGGPELAAGERAPKILRSERAKSLNLADGTPRICGLESGELILSVQDSLDEANRVQSSGFARGLSTLIQTPHVRALLDSKETDSVCVTGVVLTKSSFQDMLELFNVEVELKSGERLSIPMLILITSIQGSESLNQRRPWAGFPRKELASGVRELLKTATFSEVANESGNPISPLAIAAPLFSRSNVVGGTQSYVHIPDVDPEWSTFIVTQIRVYGTNPYASQYPMDAIAVQIQEKTGRVRVANVPSFFQVYVDLLKKQPDYRPQDSSREAQVQKLIELGR